MFFFCRQPETRNRSCSLASPVDSPLVSNFTSKKSVAPSLLLPHHTPSSSLTTHPPPPSPHTLLLPHHTLSSSLTTHPPPPSPHTLLLPHHTLSSSVTIHPPPPSPHTLLLRHHTPSSSLTTHPPPPSPHTLLLRHHTPSSSLTTHPPPPSPHTLLLPHHTPSSSLTTHQAPFVAGQLAHCLDNQAVFTPILMGFNPAHLARSAPPTWPGQPHPLLLGAYISPPRHTPIQNWNRTFHDGESAMIAVTNAGNSHARQWRIVQGASSVQGLMGARSV